MITSSQRLPTPRMATSSMVTMRRPSGSRGVQGDGPVELLALRVAGVVRAGVRLLARQVHLAADAGGHLRLAGLEVVHQGLLLKAGREAPPGPPCGRPPGRRGRPLPRNRTSSAAPRSPRRGCRVQTTLTRSQAFRPSRLGATPRCTTSPSRDRAVQGLADQGAVGLAGGDHHVEAHLLGAQLLGDGVAPGGHLASPAARGAARPACPPASASQIRPASAISSISRADFSYLIL